MDYLHGRQEEIQDALAARHLAGGTLVLYDVSSAAFEGRTCPLGAIGHPKDGVRGRLQIVYGLLTSPEGVPVAIEVFKGNTGDPTTVKSQVDKVKDRFGITKVVLVGDRGMLTAAGCARTRPRSPGLDHRAARPPGQGAGPRRGPAADPVRYPGPGRDHLPGLPRRAAGGLQNPFLEAERARSGNRCWPPPRPAWPRSPRPARGPGGRYAARTRSPCARTGSLPAAGRQAFTIDIGEDHLRYARNQDSIAAEAALDGIYVLRPASPPATWTARRSSPPTRPWPRSSGPSAPSIPTWTSGPSGTAPKTGSARTCSCGCCRTTSAGTCRPGSRPCCSPTTTSPPPPPPDQPRRPGRPSPRALAKAATKHTPGDLPVHSFATLLADLGTICLNTIAPADPALPGSGSLPLYRCPAAGLRAARRQPAGVA